MDEGRARLALALGVISFVAVPLSYSWVLSPGSNPPWLTPVIATAEWGGLAAAIAAIWHGRRALSLGATGPAATWAPRIGIATIVVYIAMLIAVAVVFRS
jgi:hypothetical protein